MNVHSKHPILLAFAAVVLTSGLALARPKSTNPVKHMELTDTVTLDGTSLAPGRYNVTVDNGKATFERDKQTVLVADCDWKTLPSKSLYDSVVIQEKTLREIDFAGSTQALELK